MSVKKRQGSALYRMPLMLLSLLVLTGCSTLEKRSVDLGGGGSLLLPPPHKISKPRKLRQLLTVESSKGEKSFEVILSLKKESLTMIALGPMGNTIFNIVYDGKKIQHSSWLRGEKAEFIENALADFVLTYMPLVQLKKYLSRDVRIVQKTRVREIYVSDKLIVEINYTDIDPWEGQLDYHHILRTYRLKIKKIESL